MVPAAPLLPTTEPDSAVVAHRAGPAAVLVVEALGAVEVATPVVVELPAGAAPPVVVDDADEPDEQALSTVPLHRIAPATAATTTGLVTLIDRPPPSWARRLHHRGWCGTTASCRQYGSAAMPTS
jgi:hypothetical protein